MATTTDPKQMVGEFLGRFPEGFPEGVSVLDLSDTRASVVVNTVGSLVLVHESVDYHPPGHAEQSYWVASGLKEEDIPYVTEGTRTYLDLKTGRTLQTEVYETDDVIQGVVYALYGDRLPEEAYAEYIIDLVGEVVKYSPQSDWNQNSSVVRNLDLHRFSSFSPMLKGHTA